MYKYLYSVTLIREPYLIGFLQIIFITLYWPFDTITRFTNSPTSIRQSLHGIHLLSGSLSRYTYQHNYIYSTFSQIRKFYITCLNGKFCRFKYTYLIHKTCNIDNYLVFVNNFSLHCILININSGFTIYL